jgi:large subunit ribosomal protein L22
MSPASKFSNLNSDKNLKGRVRLTSTTIADSPSWIGILTTIMEVQALTRYARMSPKKVREVARTIQGRKAADAVDYLMLVPRKSAKLIAKTLKSAIANAENNNNLSADSLTVKSAIIENGPVLKRFKAGARGTAMPRRKKMSHIRIILSDGVTNS